MKPGLASRVGWWLLDRLDPLIYALHWLLRAVFRLDRAIFVDGRGLPDSRRRRIQLVRYRLLEMVSPRVVVDDGSERYAFSCPSWGEFKRADRMLDRETGTIDWLRADLRPGDVFYDIGANVGVFTLYAGKRVGDGLVYAFEPHVGNAARLMENVEANGLAEVVRVLSCAVSDRPGFFDFSYGSLRAGTSFSHLHGTDDAAGDGRAAGSELKYATTIDSLIEEGAIKPADVVKIDVDGQEHEILLGMRSFLSGEVRPRALQVEVNTGERDELCDLMADYGFELFARHRSAGTMAHIEAGEDPDAFAFNGIFRPR